MKCVNFETSEGNLLVPESSSPVGVILEGEVYDFYSKLNECGEFSSGQCMARLFGRDYLVLGMTGYVLVVDDPKYTI